MILPSLSHKTAKSTRSILNEGFVNFLLFCTKNGDDKNNGKSVNLPPEPQNCCMSGCANCVWVAYAEEVAKILNDGGETAKKKILENIKDPNLRSFLMLELDGLFKKGK